MNVIGIDPGPEQSALVVWTGIAAAPIRFGPNEDILRCLIQWKGDTPLVIEKVASFGMPVGAEIFETVYWSGRFAQAYGENVHRITRIEVKNHLCHSSRANDANVRQSIIDRFGGKDKAIGKKACPGVLYDIKADLWSALAVALTWRDLNVEKAA